jgi:hypothetical protein
MLPHSTGLRDFPKMTRCRRGLQHLRRGRDRDCIPGGLGSPCSNHPSKTERVGYHTRIRQMAMGTLRQLGRILDLGLVRKMIPRCLDGYESGTRIFLWRRPVKDKLSVDCQEAHVFCPRSGFFLESPIQSESAVGVRLKTYWPHSTLVHHLFADGGLLLVAGTSTAQRFPPCSFQLAA